VEDFKYGKINKMKIIYMQQTIMLMAQQNPKMVDNLIQTGIIKEHKDMKYLVIEEKPETKLEI